MVLPALVLPAVCTVALYAQAAPAKKPNPAIISVQLRWVRQAPATTPDGKVPEPILLQGPILTTADGQVASFETKADPKTGAGDVFFVSLSPTLEPAENGAKAGGTTEGTKGPTVRLLWSLRVSDKTFPGGVGSVVLTGATRLVVGEESDAIVARFSLADPKTGLFTEYRLSGRTTVGDTPKNGTP
ncbi:MAG: hypothetical protein H7145_14550 [Akkermansiaceae bacterium]|nr:hypothetical protein [Armatimonadota bacterium]